jgi:hypothetical protein
MSLTPLGRGLGVAFKEENEEGRGIPSGLEQEDPPAT